MRAEIHETSPKLEYGPASADIATASEDYARRFAGEVGAYFLQVQTDSVLDLLEPWRGGTVLDVGGGHAQLAPPLVDHGFNVVITGSDESCRRRLDRLLRPGSFEFQECNALDLPFDDQQFDAVVSVRLISHVDRWPDLVREMCRVARHAVIVDYPDRLSFNLLQSSLFRWKKAIEKNTRTFRCFSKKEIVEQFGLHEFGSPVFRPEFFLPMVVHRAVGNARFSRVAEATTRSVGLTRFFGSPVILRTTSRRVTLHADNDGSER